MTSVEKEGVEKINAPSLPQIYPQKYLRWTQILAVSIFWFALNFHWSAIGVIILPSQVFKLVGELHEGETLAFVLVPGAFVSLFTNPLFGLFSDRMHGQLAHWGRRRPYILGGTLLNIGALFWMALARDIPSLTFAYILLQFSSNAAQAPFHALLPDIVPVGQRGLTSGIMGLLSLLGSVAGVVVAGLFVDATKPLPVYQHNLWILYGIIIIALLLFMLITLVSVRERPAIYVKNEAANEDASPAESMLPQLRNSWRRHSFTRTIVGTLLAMAIFWTLISLWNTFWHPQSIVISPGVTQVILEVVATIGILRMFQFDPRRTSDFAWVLLTRLLMMLGIYTIQDFLQYYMRDVVGVQHPEQEVTKFVLLVSLSSLISTLMAGWLSDRFGRKRIVYIAGSLMGLVGLIFIFTHSLVIIIAAGAIFGLGYGAYISVDWALVADVLPSTRNYARDMGVWNISLSLPQVIAPVLGGPLIDFFSHNHQPVLGFQILFAIGVAYCVVATVTIRYIRGVKN